MRDLIQIHPVLFIVVLLLAVLLLYGFAARGGFSRIDGFIRSLPNDAPLRRMWPLYSLFLVCFAVVLCLNPMKAGLTLFGVGKVLLGGLGGYFIDRYAFREADRPHLLTGIERGTAWKRRAWIICAAIIGFAVGVP